MSEYKLVPVEPTQEMVSAAEDAYMPFGDMDLALRMAILTAPDVQGKPGVKWAPEEVANGNKGIRWVSDEGVHGRPTDHDCRVYLESNPNARGCHCPECAMLYTAPQPAEQQPCPEGVREGAPYDDPAFESLCREHEIWGTPAAAQCAVFWEAGKRVAEQKAAPHPDDAAVDRFAAAMKAKLNKKRQEGRGGWQSMTAEQLSTLLHEHVRKGDPVDVANLAMMLHQNGQRIEQQPALAKYQPCGCVVCTCENETRCQGCGAEHCGTHPVGQIPEPVYQQPAPDVSALVEELVEALELARIDLKEWLKSFPVAAREPTGKIIERIDAALAAYRKQEPGHD